MCILGDPANISVDWGDNDTTLVFSTTKLIKNYALAGPYNVRINISNPFSWQANMTTLCVQDLVFDVALNVTTGVEVGVSNAIQLSMTTGSHYTCVITITNEDSTFAIVTRTHLDPDVFFYTFSFSGTIQITMTCSNDISTETWTNTVNATERISGVALTPPGAQQNKEFQIVLTWITGSDVALQLWYDGVEQTMEIDAATRTARSGFRIETAMDTHNITYFISNTLDPTPPLVSVLFGIVVKITSPNIICTLGGFIKNVVYQGQQVAVVPLGSVISCDVTMTYGTGVTLEIDWGYFGAYETASNDLTVAWDGSPLQATFPRSHVFLQQQFGIVKVKVSNSFNSYKKEFPVWVMVPPTGITLMPNPTDNPKIFAPPADVWFNFTVPTPLPNEITCVIGWGDGNTDTIFPCDIQSPILHKYYDRVGESELFFFC